MKKIIYMIMVMVMVVTLSSCDTTDKVNADTYEQANEALNNYDYYNAILLFESLGEYEDSKQKLTDSIDKYISELVNDKNWDEAVVFLEKYKSLVEYNQFEERYIQALNKYVEFLINAREWEKAKTIIEENESFDIVYLYDYVIYSEAINYLEYNTKTSYSAGLEVLSQIKEESKYYEKAQQIINTYQELITSSIVEDFLGKWESSTISMGLRFDMSLTFQLYFENEKFKIICIDSTNQDGYTTTSRYNFDLDDFQKNRATSKSNYFAWVINQSGTLTYYTKYDAHIYEKV